MSKSGKFSIELSQTESCQSGQETQQERFRRVAQELGCDEDEAAFDEKLRTITKPKPEPKSETAKRQTDDK